MDSEKEIIQDRSFTFTNKPLKIYENFDLILVLKSTQFSDFQLEKYQLLGFQRNPLSSETFLELQKNILVLGDEKIFDLKSLYTENIDLREENLSQ